MIEISKKFRTTGSVLDKNKNRKRSVLIEEKLDEIGAFIERSPRKSDTFVCTVWRVIGICSHSNETSEIATV
jgi:hypothetical protein